MKRRGARVVEEARLESVYTPKAYHGFESRSLRKKRCKSEQIRFTPFFVSPDYTKQYLKTSCKKVCSRATH